jgi:ribosomal-protein-serine acetyltransferase
MMAFWRRWMGRKQVVFSLGEDADLRQLTMQDAPALFELTVRNRERLRRWMTWVDFVCSEDDTRGFIRESLRNFRSARSLQMGIWLNGSLVGTIGLFRTASAEPEAEIGYWIDEAAEGQGLVTRATRVLTEYAFEQWQVPTVRIRVEPDNVRSRAIPERLGFRLRGETEEDWADGSHRTLLVYVMHASDFRQGSR